MNANHLEEVRRKIKELDTIPTIPAVVEPLVETLRGDPDTVDLAKVKELLSYDKTIAAQCLRLANSPLFGRRPVETLHEAIVALGIKRIQSIALGCSLNQIVSTDRWGIDAQVYWRHSLGCALVSRKMAALIGYPDPEKAYLAGLLHDLGILVNSQLLKTDYQKCVRRAQSSSLALDKAEEQDFGFTHSHTGKLLAERWNLPAEQIEVVGLHHNVEQAHNFAPLVSIVHLSDLLCRVRDLGYGYYEILGIDLAGDYAWTHLVDSYPELKNMDLARFSIDIEASMDSIAKIVGEVFTAPIPTT